MTRPRKWWLLAGAVGVVGVVAAGCPPAGQRNAENKPAPPAAPARAALAGEVSLVDTDDPGLTFKLREGVEGAGARQATPPAKTTPLDDAATARVLAKLPPLKTDAGDQKEFAMRERSLPAPRTGKTVKGEFPPPQTAPAPDPTEAGELKVLRHMPDGEVPLAPHVSLTFSQPMVPVTSYAELEKLPIPAKLTPQPPGRWRWLGAKTLLYEAGSGSTDRFPMATEYTVEVPAGTKSQNGGALAQPARFTFSTPPPTVQSFAPQGGPVKRDPIIFVAFDQRVDQAAVLGSITARAAGKDVAMRLATADEIKGDEGVARAVADMAADSHGDRWVAFRPRERLPVDTYVTVDVGPGTPSMEGPRKTEKVQQYGFKTYGPMRISSQNCEAKDHCSPFSAFWVQLTNPIDEKAFKRDMVKIEPAIPNVKIIAAGNGISISGTTKGRSTYKVTYAASIPDVFEQTLEKPETITFTTGPAGKSLFAMGGNFIVIDPAGGPRFSVYSINYSSLKVKLFAADPESWSKFSTYMREVYNREKYPPDPPLTLISSETVTVKGEPDQLTETRLDLSKAVPKGAGSVVLLVEPPERPKERWQWTPVMVWAQVTDIGLDAMVDHDELIGWATNLKDGKPLADVALTVTPSGLGGTTGADGIARLPLVDRPGSMLIGKKGDQVAFLPENTSYWSDGGSWSRSNEGEQLRWYVADDRQMYKPGEEVKLKGWIRRIGGGEQGDVMGFDAAASKVTWSVNDSRGNEVLKGEAQINALGGFDTSFKLPPTMNLGTALVRLQAIDAKAAGGEINHTIEVQEFRRPEFEVSAQASEGPYFVGGQATVAVTASYYAGGGLANAETHWSVTASPSSYRPPNHDDYVFGKEPSWYDDYGQQPVRRGRGGRGGFRPSGGETRSESFQGHTDSAGKHVLGLDFLAVNPPRPMIVNAQASVMDVNRQAWGAQASLLVHPANLYVGLKSGRPFMQQGQPIEVDAIVTDLDGKVVTGRRVDVVSARLDWDYENGEVTFKEVDVKECALTSAEKAGHCTLATGAGGMYRLRATVGDERGRKNLTEMSIWVAGGKLPPQRGVEVEQVRLVPDKKEYRAGDNAEVLIIPPFYPADAVVTLRRSGIFRVEHLRIEGASHTLTVKIEEGWTPNVYVHVALAGSAPRVDDNGVTQDKLPRRPAVGEGSVSLAIPPLSRQLALTVKPREAALEPGGETQVALTLRDAAGEPVQGGEVAVVIVDEAVLALTGYHLPDPIPIFYNGRDPGARDYHLRQSLLLGKPQELQDQMGAMGGEGGRADGIGNRRFAEAAPGAMPPSPAPMEAPMAQAKVMVADADAASSTEAPTIKIRSDFNALAVFAPSVRTDEKGQALVPVKLPDNLTRYRVMAIAVAGQKQFGAGEATITARLPLMVRPSAPRFLNFGDRFELPVVLQNQTDKAMEVDLAARVANLELTAGAGRHVTVPANDRVEVRLPAAAMKVGTARFQIGAVATAQGRWSDAAQLELPVWTPATTEAFATYGTIDNGSIAQAVKMPEGVFPQFGGLEVTTSSTALQALTDALLYLVRYPYECSEQMASRILAVAALRDVLTAFQAEGLPAPDAILASVKKDVEMLRRLQNYDGGWGFWKRGDESWPFLTAHVAHALARAKAKGFDVPGPMIQQVSPYLHDIESHVPAFYPVEARRALAAYGLYVRLQLGDRDAAKAQRLISEAGGVEKLPLEAVAWIYPVLSGDQSSSSQLSAIRKLVANRVEETAGAAHFVTSYGDNDYLILHSDRRIDALFLEGLIVDDPKNDVIPKLVEGLLGHRTAGRWESTQESAWVLLALDKYFNTYEKVTPNFVAKVWLGEQYAGDHAFKGRTTERHEIDVPMSWLAAKGKDLQQLIVAKDGAGRLYYRIGMTYAPTDLRLPPRDNGFVVTREYEAVDDKADVRREQDGTWRVKAGARVRVRVTMVAPARRYHVALVDPLPAGFETMNPALAVTGEIPKDPKDQSSQGPWWWWRPWYEHQNMRDERAEAFASLLWEGVHEYTYVARATTPGTWVAPPPKAEEMYHPETFGRGAGDKVIVE